MAGETWRVACRSERVTGGPTQHFFGYYDKCPWDASGRLLLAMEASFIDRLPSPSDTCLVGVVDLDNQRRFEPLAETRAWNWQQGAMAQWLPSAPDRTVLYNDREGDRFVTVIFDIKGGTREVLPLPISAVSPNGRFGLSVSFARLARFRPAYGYAGMTDPGEHELYPKNDGIHWMDLASGEHRLILSYAQVAAFRSSPLMETGPHTLEHLAVSPGGSRFCFLHRFPLRDGGLYTRLLTASVDGSDLHVLAHGWVSHYCWRGPREILAWSRSRPLITALRGHGAFERSALRWAANWVRRQHAPLVRHTLMGDGFRLYRDDGGRVEPVGSGILTEDGHCSFSPDGRWLLTDTYPSADRQRLLLLFDRVTDRRIEVGRFFSPPAFDGVLNCDLHPRWNPAGTHVCVDSAHEGDRQIYIVDVRPALQAINATAASYQLSAVSSE